VEDASTVTARGESCVGLFNAIAQGEALDPKVVSQEIDALLGLLGRLDRAGRHKEALRVARDLAALLALFLRWLDLVQSLELALRTARKIGDSEAEAWALHELGSLHLAAGDPTAAAQHLNDALSLRDKGGGYGRCVTRHNLDAARRDSADVDAVTRAQRRHRFRLVGGSALLALLATGGIALAVTTGHRSTGPTSSSTQAISTTETSTASTTHPPTTTRSTTTRSTIGSGTTGTGTSSTTSVTDTTDPQITLTTPRATASYRTTPRLSAAKREPNPATSQQSPSAFSVAIRPSAHPSTHRCRHLAMLPDSTQSMSPQLTRFRMASTQS
jgi:hypothetical protein